MRSYTPNNSDEQSFVVVLEDFFNNDSYLSENFPVFKRDLFDFFSSDSESKKTRYKNFWFLNVYYSWTYIDKFEPDDVLDYFIEQIPDAFRLGFDVAEKLSYYMSLKFYSPRLMTIFYATIRNQLLNSKISIGFIDKDIKVSDLVTRVRLISSYSENTLQVAEMYDELEKIIFEGFENIKISSYLIVDKRKAVMDCVELIDFVTAVKPEIIWESVKTIIFSKNTGVEPEEVPSSAIERPIEIEDLKDNDKKESAKVSMVEKPQAPAKPTYQEISQKIDAVFEKDADGNYEDLDSVMMALEKASKKYNDPKIAELYYFDEQSGKFKWNI